MIHNAITYYIYSISYVKFDIRWFDTDGFRVFFPILYFLLFLLIFLLWTIGGIIFLNFFLIYSNYVNVTFIFYEIDFMIGPMNDIFWLYLIPLVYSLQEYHLFQFCFLWEILLMGDCCMMQKYNRQWTYMPY